MPYHFFCQISAAIRSNDVRRWRGNRNTRPGATLLVSALASTAGRRRLYTGDLYFAESPPGLWTPTSKRSSKPGRCRSRRIHLRARADTAYWRHTRYKCLTHCPESVQDATILQHVVFHVYMSLEKGVAGHAVAFLQIGPGCIRQRRLKITPTHSAHSGPVSVHVQARRPGVTVK